MTPTVRVCHRCQRPGATAEAYDGEAYHAQCAPTVAACAAATDAGGDRP